MSTVDRPRPATATLPPLVAGERLDRATFHERYETMPPGFRAELIGGVVYMPSPAGRRHGETCMAAAYWVRHYQTNTPGVRGADNASTFLDDQGEPQPDVLLRIDPDLGGQTRHEGAYIAGAPELVIEVSASSRGTDLREKLADYERAGVLEYVVFALDPDEVFWHARRGDRLVRMPPDPDGLYRSEAFPGLWLDPRALLADDSAAMLAALDRGLATPEHAGFGAMLAGRRDAR